MSGVRVIQDGCAHALERLLPVHHQGMARLFWLQRSGYAKMKYFILCFIFILDSLFLWFIIAEYEG
jgi:hypothetical protein